MSDEYLEVKMEKLRLRWKAKGESDSKLVKLIRQSLWLGANVPHFRDAGIPEAVVMPVYKKMPEQFHIARAQAVLIKSKKEKNHED